MNSKQYSDEEARSILKRAVDLQGFDEGQFSRDQLLAMGHDLGLSQEAIVKAEREHLVQQSLTIPADALEIAFRLERTKTLNQHLAVFVMVMAILILLNFVTTGFATPWFFVPLMAWGFALLFHFFHARATSGEDYEEEFDEWLAQRDNAIRKRQERLGNVLERESL
jgi:hypothetical protein